ncbi:MAG: radical SAM protein [Clostridia bacterium]|nr:radical SAM protein [Clostridia bacterium]
MNASLEAFPLTVCRMCPRQCGADRENGGTGVCGMPADFFVSRIAPHMWEEPPVSGTKGSGTVFFTGCNLRCVFCQNRVISHDRLGTRLTEDELIDRILALQETGVHNVNLVTPTHYTVQLARLLEKVKPRLTVPVVWNSGGYDSVEALRLLDGLVDVYLPDFKYVSPELSGELSGAPDYAAVASAALTEMFRQTGPCVFDGEGLIRRGVIVRHLVLPGCRKDSIAVLEHLSQLLPLRDIRVSVMSQYTPSFASDCPQKNLHRRVTAFEYQTVLDAADRLGIEGYMQAYSSAVADYTPDFNNGVL